MAYTFLKAQGYEVGKSLLEADQVPQVTEVIADAERRGVEIVLPVDLVAAAELRRRTPSTTWSRSPASPPTGKGLDIGPATRELFAAKLADARTVFWNGPVGRVRVPGLRGRHQGRRRGDQPGAAA